MSWALQTLFVLTTSCILLLPQALEKRVATPYEVKPISAFIHTRLMLIRYDFKSQKKANLMTSYVTGVKRGLTKKIKMAHKELHLVHLFTPSGLHFSTLFILFIPFWWGWKKYHHPLWLLPLSILALAPLGLNEFYAMKRIGLLKIGFLAKELFKLRTTSFNIFLVVFLIDFKIGTYQDSPLSFSLSFLFLGLIFSAIGHGRFFFLFNLLLGQVIASLYFQAPLFIPGFLCGFFLTTLFSFLYPFFFLSFLTAPWLETSWVEPLISFYLEILFFAHQFSRPDYYGVHIDSIFVFALFFSLYLFKKRWLWIIILSSAPILNLPMNHHQAPWYYTKLKQREVLEVKRFKRGHKLKDFYGKTCLLKLYQPGIWFESCRPDWANYQERYFKTPPEV